MYGSFATELHMSNTNIYIIKITKHLAKQYKSCSYYCLNTMNSLKTVNEHNYKKCISTIIYYRRDCSIEQ